MSDIAKQILQEMNKSLSVKLNEQFIKYLEEIEQRKLINIASKINWSVVVSLFESEYNKLWNKLVLPKVEKDLVELKKEFKTLVLANIKQRLFHSTYKYLKENESNKEIMDKMMDEMFPIGIYELFRVFDFQFALSSLNKNNDAKVILMKINELKARAEAKSPGKKQLEEEIKVFKMIEQELERRERIGQRWSIRAACDYYGRNELGYNRDGSHQSELDTFYKRYLTYRKKSTPFR